MNGFFDDLSIDSAKMNRFTMEFINKHLDQITILGINRNNENHRCKGFVSSMVENILADLMIFDVAVRA